MPWVTNSQHAACLARHNVWLEPPQHLLPRIASTNIAGTDLQAMFELTAAVTPCSKCCTPNLMEGTPPKCSMTDRCQSVLWQSWISWQPDAPTFPAGLRAVVGPSALMKSSLASLYSCTPCLHMSASQASPAAYAVQRKDASRF